MIYKFLFYVFYITQSNKVILITRYLSNKCPIQKLIVTGNLYSGTFHWIKSFLCKNGKKIKKRKLIKMIAIRYQCDKSKHRNTQILITQIENTQMYYNLENTQMYKYTNVS